ncbi:MAG: hypothetical protein QXR48_03285 [Candidatus Woesearchaeota archaeon]
MRHLVIAIVGIVLIIAIAGTVLSQGKRIECLNACRAEGDACAEKVYRADASCTAEKTVCESVKTTALRRCQADYDACRWNCDLPPF